MTAEQIVERITSDLESLKRSGIGTDSVTIRVHPGIRETMFHSGETVTVRPLPSEVSEIPKDDGTFTLCGCRARVDKFLVEDGIHYDIEDSMP